MPSEVVVAVPEVLPGVAKRMQKAEGRMQKRKRIAPVLRDRIGVRTRFLHYSSPCGCGAASRKRLLRGDAGTGPVQLLRRRPLLLEQGHQHHVVEGIAFAGELAQQLLKGKDEGRTMNDEGRPREKLRC